MGHVRLAKLPATRKWRDVVAMLASEEFSIKDIAEASADAANGILRKAADDPVFTEVFRLLCKIPQAAKENDFKDALGKLGIHVHENPSLIELAEAFSQRIERFTKEQKHHRTDLGEMAHHAAVSSLIDNIDQAAPTLWRPNRDDIRHAVGKLAAPEKFGELSQYFFTGLTHRLLTYYLHRELPKHVSSSGRFNSIAALSTFNTALETHCRESSFIMRAFAKDWYGKAYSKRTDIQRKDARGFVYVSANKIGNEFDKRKFLDA